MWHFLLLSRISNWIFKNQLLINSDKTKLIIFGSRAMVSKAQDLRVSLLWKEIKSVVSGKDLGVVLDPSLTCNDHVASTASSCKARLGQINRVKQAFATETFTMIIIKSVSMRRPGRTRQGVIMLKSPISLKLGTNVRYQELAYVTECQVEGSPCKNRHFTRICIIN